MAPLLLSNGGWGRRGWWCSQGFGEWVTEGVTMEIRHPNVAVRDLGNRQREVNYWQVLQLKKLAITIDALHSWTPKLTLLFVRTYFMSWFSVFVVNWPFLETGNGSWLALISLSNQTPGGSSALKVIIKPCQVLLSDSGIAFRKQFQSSLEFTIALHSYKHWYVIQAWFYIRLSVYMYSRLSCPPTPYPLMLSTYLYALHKIAIFFFSFRNRPPTYTIICTNTF